MVDVDTEIGDPVATDGGDTPLVVTRWVRLSRNDAEARRAVKLMMRWHGPDLPPEYDKRGRPKARPSGWYVLQMLGQMTEVNAAQIAAAIGWIDEVSDWCLREIAEFAPHMDGHPEAAVIVEARRECLVDCAAVIAVLRRCYNATTL